MSSKPLPLQGSGTFRCLASPVNIQHNLDIKYGQRYWLNYPTTVRRKIFMVEDKQGSESLVRKRAYSTDRDRLKALQIKRIEGPGIYHDGGGLYLQVSTAGTKSWLFRYRLHGRMREMGLGSFKDFSLAEARERARVQRQLVADKIDPIEQRDTRSQVAISVVTQEISFEECARNYHKQEAVH